MRRFRMAGWITVMVAVWCAGCAGPQRLSRMIAEQGQAGEAESFVRLDRAQDASRFDHPAVVSAARLKELFASITVQRQRGLISAVFPAKPRRAFTDEELEFLSAQVSRALAEAMPQEEVVFFFNTPDRADFFNVTSGGVYVRQGKLVVVLANSHYTILKNEQAMGHAHVSVRSIRENPLYRYPENEDQIILGAGQTLLGGDASLASRLFGETRHGIVMALASPPPMPGPEPSRPKPPTVTPNSSSDTPSVLPVPPVVPVSPQPPPVTVTPPGVPSPLEEKLRLLKKLRDDGLITEQDYDAKKNEMLKAF